MLHAFLRVESCVKVWIVTGSFHPPHRCGYTPRVEQRSVLWRSRYLQRIQSSTRMVCVATHSTSERYSVMLECPGPSVVWDSLSALYLRRVQSIFTIITRILSQSLIPIILFLPPSITLRIFTPSVERAITTPASTPVDNLPHIWRLKIGDPHIAASH
ncbi:hypothetical protein BJX62DRAFT_91530 [Aspergillus germanicus]